MTPPLSYSFNNSTDGGWKFLSSSVWSYSPYFLTKFLAIKSSSSISSSLFSSISILIFSVLSTIRFLSLLIEEKFSIVGFKSLLILMECVSFSILDLVSFSMFKSRLEFTSFCILSVFIFIEEV